MQIVKGAKPKGVPWQQKLPFLSSSNNTALFDTEHSALCERGDEELVCEI